MTKKILIAILAVLLVLGLASCSDKSSGGGSSEPTRPATLELRNFKDNYKVGDQKKDLSGTLFYTDTKGKMKTVEVKDEGVYVTGFDTTTPGTERTVKFTYMSLDCMGTYNVVQPEPIEISGTFIVDKNTTFTFKNGSTEVTKEVWDNWSDFYNLNEDPKSVEKKNYEVGVSPAGRTVIRVFDWSYTPKDGGLASYPSEEIYFEYDSGYTPNTNYFYVSTAKEDTKSRTNTSAQGKYLVMKFDVEGNALFWFTADVESATLTALIDSNAITIPANQMSFDQAGLNFKNVTVNTTNAKNLAIILNRENYASNTRAFGFVSSGDDVYNGYAYTMKLSDVAIP